MKKPYQLTVFYCSKTFESAGAFDAPPSGRFEVRTVPMACSSMVKDLFLLKAFEAGADAVTVWVCPEGTCRHGEGNLRARKRVERVKALLEEIHLGSERLTLFNLDPGDRSAASAVIKKIDSVLKAAGRNPAYQESRRTFKSALKPYGAQTP